MSTACPDHGSVFVLPLDPDDVDERPEWPEMTHRCAACGRQLSDWFPTYEAIREMLVKARPDLSRDEVEDMSIGEVWIALGGAVLRGAS